MKDLKQTLSEFHCELKQIFFDSCQVIMQEIWDIVENISYKMYYLAGDVVEEAEDIDNEIQAFVKMSDNQIVVLKELNGLTKLQTTNGIVFLMECCGKEEVLFYGRFSTKKSEILRGAVGLSDFFMKNALCVFWRYINALVYFEVG